MTFPSGKNEKNKCDFLSYLYVQRDRMRPDREECQISFNRDIFRCRNIDGLDTENFNEIDFVKTY